MERPSFRSLPAVRRKRRAEALLLAAFAAHIALLAAIGTVLHPLAGSAVLLLGVASAVAVLQREIARGARRDLIGVTQVVERSQAPVLWDAVHACAEAAGVRAPKIFLLGDAVPVQAASWGLGADGSIGMRRSLVERFPPEWVKATVGHEMAHIAMGDLATTAALLVMRAWLRLASMTVAGLSVAAVFGAVAHGQAALLACGAMMIAGMSFIAGDAMLVIGMPHIRYRREFAADAAGVALTGDPAASVALMIFFAVAARDSSVDSRPSPGRSHPPPLARVRAVIADHPRFGGRR